MALRGRAPAAPSAARCHPGPTRPASLPAVHHTAPWGPAGPTGEMGERRGISPPILDGKRKEIAESGERMGMRRGTGLTRGYTTGNIIPDNWTSLIWMNGLKEAEDTEKNT